MNDTMSHETTQETAPEKRPVGRPKGQPRSGGRPKGAKGRLPEEFRRFIDQRGRPLEFLAAIARGNQVKAADPSDPTKSVKVYPNVRERTLAAQALLDRLLPTLKAAEITGANGGPLQVEDTTTISDFETARRLAFLLTVGLDSAPSAPVRPVAAPAEPVRPMARPEPVRSEPELLAPGMPGYPVGHVEMLAGGHTLRLEEKLAGNRERWTLRGPGGHFLQSAFSRDQLLATHELQRTTTI